MARMVRNLLGGITRMSGSESLDSELDRGLHMEDDTPLEAKLDESDPDDMGGGSEEEDMPQVPNMKGSLSKWTNYIHGWQERYFMLDGGLLSYFKSETDSQYGCRGSISLHKTKIALHEFDALRFDIRGHGSTFFLRASSEEDKQNWVDAIENSKRFVLENGPGSLTPLQRQGSALSLSAMSQASVCSVKNQVTHDLRSKLSELETYREIVCRQVDLLQAYFEVNSESGRTEITNGVFNSSESIVVDKIPEEGVVNSTPSSPVTRKDTRPPSSHSPLPSRFTPMTGGHRRTGSDPFAFRPQSALQVPRGGKSRPFSVGGGSPFDVNSLDIRAEAVTFKATTTGLVTTLSQCIDMMNKREESWQRKFEKEQERRARAESAAGAAMNGPRVEAFKYAGPDFEEGPHSALNEDEFFDALEMAYKDDEIEHTVGSKQASTAGAVVANGTASTTDGEEETFDLSAISIKSLSGVKHRLSQLVNDRTSQYACYIFEPVDSDVWSLVHQDGDMTVHRRELEEDGVVVDPLKAHYHAKGISAQEVTNFFFDKETRLEWEGTLESVDTVETLAEDTIVFHQLHKRVWPSTQRESLFCSHLCTLSGAPQPENMIGHTWMVCNFSMDHDSVPATSKLIRATLHAGLVCQTIANRKVEPGKERELTRDDITCKIHYAVQVNPGGWAPPSVVRAIGKREVCKFLKKFSECCQNNLSKSPLSL
ncbi:ceramide transfer protein-like [Halichondria panicea]|uniref:ceramide transfer protein-like n=1 Tax=Halichondria panicea TaxID=6063 RepID=UPI00312B60C5